MKKVILLLIFSCSFSAFANDKCKGTFSNQENKEEQPSGTKTPAGESQAEPPKTSRRSSGKPSGAKTPAGESQAEPPKTSRRSSGKPLGTKTTVGESQAEPPKTSRRSSGKPLGTKTTAGESQAEPSKTSRRSSGKPSEAKASLTESKAEPPEISSPPLEAKIFLTINPKEQPLEFNKFLMETVKEKFPKLKDFLKETLFSKYASDNAMLEAAIREDDFKYVKKLLDSGNIDLDFKDGNGNSFLHLATLFSENPYSTALLLKAGADPNAQNVYGSTPLHMLFNNRELMNSQNSSHPIIVTNVNGHSFSPVQNTYSSELVEGQKQFIRGEIIDLLLVAGADPNIQNYRGASALHSAVFVGEDPDSIKMLLYGEADINIKNSDGITPLYLAVYQKDLRLTKFLLNFSADPNIQDNKGITPFQMSVYMQNPAIGKYLLQAGADPNIQDKQGTSALHLAVLGEDLVFIGLLLLEDNGMKEKLNINLQDNNGQTPLHLAVQVDFWFGVYFLLQNQADTPITDNSGRTPIDWAKELDRKEILKLFEKRSPKKSNRTSKRTPKETPLTKSEKTTKEKE